MNRPIIFIINDYFGHGGHVKSFITHILSILKYTNKPINILCSNNGYLSNNIEIKSFKNINLYFTDMSKLRKLQFSYTLIKIIKNILQDNSILNIYSYECYFSALVAKSYFKNISVINSVMGGPNPFPLLDSTDLYIAVSKEQKEYVLKNAYGENIDKEKVKIIKNRIEINPSNFEKNKNESYVLVVSRFDIGMKPSLNNISNILKNLPNNIPVKIAGTGEIIDEYKEVFKDYKNIEFLGYRKDLDKLREEAFVVLGMGRSILESLLNGKASILVGYKGIELLEDIKTVSFASDYNFAGRKIKNNIDLNICVEKITNYHQTRFLLNKEILDFLDKEYSIKYFNEKYEDIINNIKSHKTSKIQVFLEYFYIFFSRLKRKFNK